MPRRGRRMRSRRRGRKSIPRTVYDAKQAYTFRLAVMADIASDSKGVCAGIIFNDPTASFANMTEHVNDLANLFTQFRLVRCRYRFYTLTALSFQEGKTAAYNTLAIGYQNRGTATMSTPVSYNQVIDNQPSFLWPVCNDTSASGRTLSQRMNKLLYNQTASSSSPDDAGAPGGIQYFGNNFAVSAPLFSYIQECWFQYRSRS